MQTKAKAVQATPPGDEILHYPSFFVPREATTASLHEVAFSLELAVTRLRLERGMPVDVLIGPQLHPLAL